MMKTREFITAAAAATTVMTGCSNEAPAPTMKYSYEFEGNVDLGLVETQRTLGKQTVAAATAEPIHFEMNNISYTARMDVPENVAARTQNLQFVPNTLESEALPLFIPDFRYPFTTNSPTGVKQDGTITQNEQSYTVLGQEPDVPGVTYRTVQGFCYGLELTSQPAIKDSELYNLAKRMVCAGLSMAAVYAIGDHPYTSALSYSKYRADGDVVNRKKVQAGEKALPLMSEDQFGKFSKS